MASVDILASIEAISQICSRSHKSPQKINVSLFILCQARWPKISTPEAL